MASFIVPSLSTLKPRRGDARPSRTFESARCEVIQTADNGNMQLCAGRYSIIDGPKQKSNSCYPMILKEVASDVSDEVARQLLTCEEELRVWDDYNRNRVIHLHRAGGMSIEQAINAPPRKQPGRACYPLIAEHLVKEIVKTKKAEAMRLLSRR
eukprot:CAMPEP_0184645038 /NCGR_PEP_ID=MMETSP0308-20130426/1605_1 /TAXON_ID=38269 /ORGANISM="Gloeochaete witrockiana, Strain SAG 46.84" /LENGTH=153 /DNA_ID=CAMNT_0027073831 /DNA_START=84 /DNA_END=545 /DNA_ORIENTATION=-